MLLHVLLAPWSVNSQLTRLRPNCSAVSASCRTHLCDVGRDGQHDACALCNRTLLEPAAGRKYVGGVAGGARSGLGTLRLVGAGARCDEVGRGSNPHPGPSPTRLPPQAQPQP